MFQSAASFNGDLSMWDVSSVTTMVASELKDLCIVLGLFGWLPRRRGGLAGSNGNALIFNACAVFTIFYESVFQSSPLFNGNLASWDVSAVTNMEYSKCHTLFGLDRNSPGLPCRPAMMCWVVLYDVFAQCSLSRHHSTAICPRGTCRL